MKKTLFSLLFISTSIIVLAQNNVGIGTNTPNQYAKLDISSTDKGLLIPRMTTALRNALTASLGNTEQGLIIFDTDLQKFFYWDKNLGMTGNWNQVRQGSLSDGKIWIGDASNIAIEQSVSGDATISNTGIIDLTNDAVETSEINNNAVDGTKINISGNTNGSLMYYDGTDWVNIAPGSAGQMLQSNGAGAPTWIDKTAILNTQNGLSTVTSGGSATTTTPYVELGGTLYKNTTISMGSNNLIFDASTGTTRINHTNTTAATASTYPFGINRAGTTDMTLGSDASFGYLQTWNSKPLLINGQGNNVGIGLTTSPSYKLSVNGTIEAIDFGASGSQNIRIGDDAFLSDIDQAHTTGLYSTTDATLGVLRLGSGSNQIRTTNTTQTGSFGGVASFDFDPVDNTTKGILIEGGDSESGGFFANGNTAAIWSPGDGTGAILSIYDEDIMDINAPEIRVEGDGDLRMFGTNSIHMASNVATLVDRTQYTHDAANSGYRTVGGSTNALNVDIGDIVIINVTLKTAFTGGSGNDDIRFRINISGCATTNQTESFYFENFDNDRNEYESVAMQFVYTSTCAGTLTFQLAADNNSNADDNTKYGDLVIVATKY